MVLMSKIIFDASALLALLNQESGCEIVEKHLTDSVMSSINISEVVAVLIDIGIPQKDAESTVASLVKNIEDFDETQAYLTASLKKVTKQFGLSLGDRACLALAQLRKLPVLTADKAWQKLGLPCKKNKASRT